MHTLRLCLHDILNSTLSLSVSFFFSLSLCFRYCHLFVLFFSSLVFICWSLGHERSVAACAVCPLPDIRYNGRLSARTSLTLTHKRSHNLWQVFENTENSTESILTLNFVVTKYKPALGLRAKNNNKFIYVFVYTVWCSHCFDGVCECKMHFASSRTGLKLFNGEHFH